MSNNTHHTHTVATHRQKSAHDVSTGRSALGSLLLLLTLLLTPLAAASTVRVAHAGSAASISGLHVVGNRVVNGSGQTVTLRGVNRSGTEYACVQGWGFFDGPSDSASVQAIASWKATAVRVPLNETCWLGINGVSPTYSGANYHNAIKNYVNLLTQNGLVPILDLHWAAPGTEKATGLRPMPNRDHSPEFWRQVASAFKGNSSVVFDLFNEPYPDSNRDSNEAWRCWRDGGTCSGISYQVAGMQELVNAVRSTGATNPIMLSGIQYAAGLSRWLEHKPYDPNNNLIASWHMYPFSWHASDQGYWDTYVAKVAATVPLVAGEIGDEEGSGVCSTDFLTKVMAWLDSHNAGYNAWTWNVWGGCGSLSLISDYNGTATPYGQVYKDRLIKLANTAPSVKAPVQSIVKWAQLGTVNVPIRLAWSAADADGIARYRLQQSTDGGLYRDITLPTLTTTSVNRWLPPGHTYRFRVNAMDSKGLWGSWKYGPSFTLSSYQDTSSALTYSGIWTKYNSSSFYGGSVRYSGVAGARTKLGFTGRNVAWIATKKANRGYAEVWIDGTKVTTINLYASSLQPRRIVYTRSWTSSSSHTIEIWVLGQKTSAAASDLVDVDAIIVAR